MHVFSVRLEGAEAAVNLLIVQYSGEHSIENLFEQIYDGYPEYARADAIVLRPDVRDTFSATQLERAIKGISVGESKFLSSVAAAHSNPDVGFGRFSTLPVFVLHMGDFKALVSENVNPLTTPIAYIGQHLSRPDAIIDIMEAEMRFVVSQSGALLPPVENMYYDNPSHRSARSFLRVGNVQYSRLAIDAVTFWLLPHIHGCEALLVDTWSLSSVAFNVSRVLAAIRGDTPIPVEMLSQYQTKETKSALTEILDRLISDAGAPHGRKLKTACIVSVTHTGSLVNILSAQVETSLREIELHFVAVFRLGNSPSLPALCDLSRDEEFTALTREEVQGRVAIPIDEKIYFPVRYVDIEHELLVPQANPFRSFVEMVKGKDIISVHRTQNDGGQGRHHAIHVDTEKLVELPDFQTKFEEALMALAPPPSLILTPDHAAARRMSELACEIIERAHGHRPEVAFHANLDFKTSGLAASIDSNVRATLIAVPEESAILILDDCYITGARLTGYQTRLRQNNIKARLHYMVALARPDRPMSWVDFIGKVEFRAPEDKNVHKKNTVTAIFHETLPNWQEEKCPWCRERLVYESLQRDGSVLPDKFAERHRVLTDLDTGLQQHIFVNSNSSPIKLYSGSVFASHGSSQAEVFASVAAAIQQLRVKSVGDKPLLGPRRHPVSTVLSAGTYLDKVYTDTVIRASFLRGADWQELVYGEKPREDERSSLIEKIVQADAEDISNLTAELLIAHALHKCTVTPDALPEGAGAEIQAIFDLIKDNDKSGRR